MKISRKFWLLFLTAAVATVTASLIGWERITLLFNRDALIDFFDNAGPNSVWIFMVAHIVANAIGIPGTVLVVVGGAVFGLIWGTVWSVIGATLGAIAAFLLARYLFHDWFQSRFYHRPIFKKVNAALCDNPLNCVLTLRVSPVSPFNIVNFAFGITAVPLRAYAIGTLLGIIPGTLAYTWLGVTGAQALEGGSRLPLLCCLLLLTMLSAIPMWLKRHRPTA